MSALRSLAIADCAKFLRENNARCASRLVLEADRRNLSAAEWADLSCDTEAVKHHCAREFSRAIDDLSDGRDDDATKRLAALNGDGVAVWARGVRRDVAHAAQG